MTSEAYQSRPLERVALAGLLIAAMLGGCSPIERGATFDGWTAGARETCPVPNVPQGAPWPQAWDCQASLALWLAAATEGLDRRDPGHAPIGRAGLYQYAGTAMRSGGCCQVAVFELIDGSIRAIGVGHPGIDSDHLATVDYGP